MQTLKDILRQYWFNLLAIAVFFFALARYWIQFNRLAQESLMYLALSFVGLVMVIASEEWTDSTGAYGWTREQWRMTPAWWVRIVGVILLVRYAIALYYLNTLGKPTISFL